MSSRTVLVIGATGYIGGSVLSAYLRRFPQFSFSAIVRNPKDVGAIEALGVKAIVGSGEDHALVKKLASEYDIVINAADADDLPLAKSIIDGLTERVSADESRAKPIYIHTSGSGVVVSPEADGGLHPPLTDKIYDDNVIEDIKSIGPGQPHRQVDLTIFEASERGIIDPYIIAPSTIYGRGTGPVRNMSVQINGMIRTAVKHKEVLYIGAGTNIWNHVHIDDLAELYALVLELALSGKNKNVSFANFFWGSAGQHVWGDVARALAPKLQARGLVTSSTPKSVTLEDAPELKWTANNSRTVANRGLALGWKPEGKSIQDTLDDEIELTLSQL